MIEVPRPHPASLSDDELLRQCTERRLRRSGPGGQNRNKVETAVVLNHEPTGLTAEANERRSQAENRRVALFRLRMKLAVSVRSVVTVDGEPSVLWLSRCHGGRIAVNSEHADFPTLIAEMLDVLAANSFDLQQAGQRLNCTASQLAKLLRSEPTAWIAFNQERTARGWPRLK